VTTTRHTPALVYPCYASPGVTGQGSTISHSPGPWTSELP
jgi:hypothetical protein